jgi:hypothetical protein
MMAMTSTQTTTPNDSQPDSAPESLVSSLASRQNEPWSLRLLAAQRQLYREAKRWQQFRSWSVVGLAAIGVAATLFAPSLLPILGPIGVAFAVAQWVALLLIRRRTKLAAATQESFDTTVFGLPWNAALVTKPDPEDVVAADSRFKGDRAKLLDWYTVPTGAGYPYDILLSQRTNIRWDAALRRAYANSILAGVVALVILLLGIGALKGLSLGEFGLAILPSVAALILGAETVRSHRQHADGQLDLKRQIEAAWAKSIRSPRSVKKAELRAIQDCIYRFRTVAPPVPERFYWKNRDRYEQETREAVKRMWQEVQA